MAKGCRVNGRRILLAFFLIAGSSLPVRAQSETTKIADAAELESMAARFTPVDIGADVTSLPPSEFEAFARLVAAARLMDTLFLRQSWAGNETLYLDLARDDSRLGRARRNYFLINKGPWSRLD